MNYLGKRFLNNWVKEQLNTKKAEEYGKYRGDEWLKGEGFDLFCCQGKLINLSINEYNEKKEKYEEVERKSYYLENGKWILRYHRIGKDIKVYK